MGGMRVWAKRCVRDARLELEKQVDGRLATALEKKKRIEARIERSSSSTGSETVAAAADHGVAQMLSFIAQMQTDLAEQAHDTRSLIKHVGARCYS